MKLYLFDRDEPGGAEAFFRAAVLDYCGAAICADFGDEIPAVAREPNGKPYFSESPLNGQTHFSLSHSGAYWAVLFHDAEVGLDIEDMDIRGGLTDERRERIAERFFAEDEKTYILAGEDHADRLTKFFRVWTAKEAYIKYTGNGMSESLPSFSALCPPEDVTIVTFTPALCPPKDVTIVTSTPAPSLVCSVCCATAPRKGMP
ncbi:MAG: 4'-phosphopantetheinyl transferase superfamily protein [Clostridiales Family XIII bacterium]|nr:4'-phosphopantetheinyl transferase superfamily protein [Clostridiales Family XIII bacterium]